MKILVACEKSQEVCKAFREKGHEAFSCDVQPCSGGRPEWHIQDDVRRVLRGWRKVVFAADCVYEEWDEEMECAICPNCEIDYSECACAGPTQDDEYEYAEFNGVMYARPHKKPYWDMLIAFPPCTHLAVSGAKHFEKKRKDGRQQEAVEFFMEMVTAPIQFLAVENPVGIMSRLYRKPDQIIQPYYFGDAAQKTTCLWLKNLPKLLHNDRPNLFDETVTHTHKGDFYEFVDKQGKKKKMPLWYAKAFLLKGDEPHGETRSKTFPGIAKAMADQWGLLIPKY
jgi:hypothetical protein